MSEPVYRAMYADKDQKPLVKDSANGLGIRLAQGEEPGDVTLSHDGLIIPNGEGMSVVNDVERLPRHRRPRRLGGSAKDKYKIFSLSDIDFEDQISIDDDLLYLQFKKDPGTACVAFKRACAVEEGRQAIVRTRPRWKDTGK